jgi:hypothetical protein
MLKILVSYALGPWGLKVLYFYLEHAAIINSIFFAYGLFLVMAHYNFTKILANLEQQFNEGKANKSKKRKISIDVEKGISEAKSFPFVSGQISLIARKTNKENVLRFLKKEARWVKLIQGSEIIYKS